MVSNFCVSASFFCLISKSMREEKHQRFELEGFFFKTLKLQRATVFTPKHAEASPPFPHLSASFSASFSLKICLQQPWLPKETILSPLHPSPSDPLILHRHVGSSLSGYVSNVRWESFHAPGLSSHLGQILLNLFFDSLGLPNVPWRYKTTWILGQVNVGGKSKCKGLRTSITFNRSNWLCFKASVFLEASSCSAYCASHLDKKSTPSCNKNGMSS